MDKINTGTALVTGIQDISAFLAIIGTEQCERHVGAALQGGFLYAAATPMSLFGSVGVIKVSASILVASISPFWATILTDAGFSIEGAVAGVIAATPRTQRNASKYSVPWFRHWPWLARLRRAHTMKNNQEQHITIPPYIAAQKFKELLEKQHIVEPQLALQFNYSRWNGWLCIWTGLLSGLNIIPYIPFILDDRPPSKPIPAWAFPLTRIVGSAVAVVVCQMIIQIQMERILRSTAQSSSSPGDPEQGPAVDSQGGQIELHDMSGGSYRTPPSQVPLLGAYSDDNPSDRQTNLHHDCGKMNHGIPFVPSSLRLRLLQVLLFIGLGATAFGYVGCFTLVQNAKTVNHTYIWLGVEITLALVRIFIWGLNPNWDEPPDIALKLSLPRNVECAPTITTGREYESILKENGDPFVVLTASRFLEYISPYTGPMERFSDADNHIAIYYTLAAGQALSSDGSYSKNVKVLLTTVVDLETRTTFVVLHRCPSNDPSAKDAVVHSATFEVMPNMGILTAKCGNILEKYEFRDIKQFTEIYKHSQGVANRIGGVDRLSRLRLSWSLSSLTPLRDDLDELVNSIKEQSLLPKSQWTLRDKEYLELQDLAHQWRQDFDKGRHVHILECMAFVLDPKIPPNVRQDEIVDLSVALEELLSHECACFEDLVVNIMQSKKDDHVFNQYAQKLEVKLASEARKVALATRVAKYRKMAASLSMAGAVQDVTGKDIPDTESERVWTRVIDIADANSEDIPEGVDLPEAFAEIWKRERQQTNHRLTMWKTYVLKPSNAYPSAWCATDPGLFKTMADQGCTVFDVGTLDKIAQAPDDSFLCRFKPFLAVLASLPRPTSLRRNPHVLAIDPATTALQATSGTNVRINYCLSFMAGFKATSTSMAMAPDAPLVPRNGIFRQAIGSLLVQTEQAATLRVTFSHRESCSPVARVSWRLAREKTLNGDIYVCKSDDFRLDSFTVKVPSDGVHPIDIRISEMADELPSYEFRRVWVTQQ